MRVAIVGAGPAGAAPDALPQVRTIQRIQAAAPRVILQRSLASRWLLAGALPLLAKTGLGGVFFRMALRRFALGTVGVTLRF